MTRVTTPAIAVLAAAACVSCAVPAPTMPARTTPAAPDPVPQARAVTLAWLASWCPFDWHDPRNANVERAAVFQTAQGKAADLAVGETERGYRALREQHLSARCDQLDATANPAAPGRPELVFMIATARRTLLADGRPVNTETVATTRRLVLQLDGRWLVDVAEEAG